MKKSIFIVILATLGMAIWSMPTLAATSVLFSSTNVNVKQGQNFTLTTSVNPGGIKNYTVKLELNYPADLLEVKSFTFASSWMPLSQSEYDLIDNSNGVLIKAAGYPGGLSSTTIFGTISFSAKKAGSGIITLGGNSLALDSTNQNVLSGTPQISIIIIAPTPVETPPVEESETPAPETPAALVSPEEEEVEITEEEEGVTTTQPKQQPEEKASFLAAVGSIVTFGTENIWASFFAGMIISAILIYLIHYFIRRSRRKNLG